jgi:hypothetical protein
MPIIPGYDSKRNISAERPLPVMNEAAQAFEAPLKAIDVGMEINQKWLEAQDTMDYTKYKADYATAQAKIEADAENDEDLNGSAAKIKELNSAKSDALKGIRNKALAQKVAFEADSDVAIASFKIQNTYNKKRLLANELDMDNNINIAAESRGNLLANPTLLKQADEKTFALIQANVSKGTITPAKGKDYWDRYRLGSVDLDIKRDEATSFKESYTLAELKKGKDGIYKHLTSEELAERIDSAELHIGRNKKNQDFFIDKNQEATEANMLILDAEGNLSYQEVKDNLLSLGISKEFGAKMLKKVGKSDPNAETKNEVYNQARGMQLTNAKPKAINEYILDHADQLNIQDKKQLMEFTKAGENPKQQAIIRYNSEALKEWSKKSLSLMGDVPNDIVYEFHRRVNKEKAEGARIDEIAQELQKEHIKEAYTPTALMTDVPNFIASRNNLKKVYGKQSKLKGVTPKPINAVTGSNGMPQSFEDIPS